MECSIGDDRRKTLTSVDELWVNCLAEEGRGKSDKLDIARPRLTLGELFGRV